MYMQARKWNKVRSRGGEEACEQFSKYSYSEESIGSFGLCIQLHTQSLIC
ncbi:hypothetical protein HanXRQr2_Chr05g0236461 [Helianthus annuus]|uniref:Uncharacterized protein n=1 Tax=Helianthus annuus TaxID=4232 RepID=A0A9K3J2Q2_HELAN|nr:hypothetical protein HanXRQr2_Chr05g0236461 [Helianthus annuus]KAJ0571783.1 hypothetical protein HanHA300_Chr05g0193931 [Helianthus annuus]KAJ0586157.1 hypothetical protein HanHA89_Chr05g0208731 [Helianthus annuus]KAJ0623174.1 hypothetical protein HanIR_Chr01g0028871 [Helianthus annuus]